MAKAWSGWLPSDALDSIKKWVDAYNIPTNQERHACVPTSNCKDMHFFAMYISLLFCNVVYKECSGEGYHTRVPHCMWSCSCSC